MPVPAILGAGLIIGAISKLFTFLFDLAAKYLTRRVAFSLAALGTVLALFVTFYTAASAAVSGLSVALPSELLGVARLFLPSNTQAVLAAMITVRIAAAVFVFNARVVFKKVAL